jgi:rhodanese-related sulfurtransferase
VPDVDRPVAIEIGALKRFHDAGAAVVVDAREAGEYAEGHIAGAISLPYNDALAEPERLQRLGENGRPIVVYCGGGACELSMDLARFMLNNGRKRVLVYEGGWPEWQAAGYPAARGAAAGGR